MFFYKIKEGLGHELFYHELSIHSTNDLCVYIV